MKRILMVAMLAACGGDDAGSDEPIAEQTLTGLVAGQPWEFVAGEINFFLSEGEDDYFAALYATDFEECGFNTPDGPFLIVSIPKELGEKKLSLGQNMTFVQDNAENDNFVGTRGKIRVDEITDTTVTGALRASFDSDNEVEGEFTVTLCPPDP